MAKVTEEQEPLNETVDVCGAVACTRLGLIGDFDYSWLCMPQISFGKKIKPPPFLAKDAKLPLFVALVMGLQHCLAMLGGIITPPSLIAADACFAWQYDKDLCESKEYLISASLMTSGILTIMQVLRFKLCKGYTLGTGLISVMGTSFTFLPLAREIVTTQIKEGKSGMDAYGKVLGTCLVASLLEIVLSFVPPTKLKKLFPPLVSGTCVMLIGVSLCSTGMKYWGGGVFCAENDVTRAAAFGSPQVCTGNGEVQLGYGAPEYVGLGSSVFVCLIAIQAVGSPFMKNSSVIIALLFGYMIAGLSSYDDGSTYGLDYGAHLSCGPPPPPSHAPLLCCCALVGHRRRRRRRALTLTTLTSAFVVVRMLFLSPILCVSHPCDH